MTTVLLPTAARPALLRKALQSVAAQTAVARIDRIYVSENAGDRGSQAVCNEFPQLPITYIFRDPPLTPLGHAQVVMKECLQGDITCILHDDDWWLPEHLESALAALEVHPDASAYGANIILTDETNATVSECSSFPWFGANYPEPTSLWRLSHSNVLLASFLGLVVHYSALVVRTTALARSAYVYDLDNPFDNDRMILFALSQHGPVLFNSKMTVGVRVHQNRETSQFVDRERCRRMAQTTRWMVESSRKPWALLAGLFVQRLTRCPNEESRKHFIREAVLRPWCLPEMAQHLDRALDKEFFAMYDQARSAFTGEAPQDER